MEWNSSITLYFHILACYYCKYHLVCWIALHVVAAWRGTCFNASTVSLQYLSVLHVPILPTTDTHKNVKWRFIYSECKCWWYGNRLCIQCWLALFFPGSCALVEPGNEAKYSVPRLIVHSLVPRLPCSRTWTLKLCRCGEPGIFCHVKSAKGRKEVERT